LIYRIVATFLIITLSIFSAFFTYAFMNPASYFFPCWLLVSCKPHHLTLIVYARVSQPRKNFWQVRAR